MALLSGKGFSKEQLTQAAILEQVTQGQRGAVPLEPQMTANMRRLVFERSLGRNQERVAEFMLRETIQGQGLGAPGGTGRPSVREQEAINQACVSSDFGPLFFGCSGHCKRLAAKWI